MGVRSELRLREDQRRIHYLKNFIRRNLCVDDWEASSLKGDGFPLEAIRKEDVRSEWGERIQKREESGEEKRNDEEIRLRLRKCDESMIKKMIKKRDDFEA